jgi:YHS domain-containing protein
MAEQLSLTDRIQAEFNLRAERQKAIEQEKALAAQERDKRLDQFGKVCDDLRAVWRPRLEEFAKQFGDKVKVTPTVTPEQRQATMDFKTDLATVSLVLTVCADSDVTKLVLDYTLRIIPMYFDYERSARLEQPLDKIDRNAIGAWIDDRLVACVKAYLSMQENEHYLKRAMVEDPITKQKFLREDSAAKLDHAGHMVYFASEDSLKQYKHKHQIDEPSAAKDASQATPSTPTVVTKVDQAGKPQAKA